MSFPPICVQAKIFGFSLAYSLLSPIMCKCSFDKIWSTPKITEPITGGEAQISVYSFTYDELKEIVAALNTEVIKTELKILDIK